MVTPTFESTASRIDYVYVVLLVLQRDFGFDCPVVTHDGM